MPFFHRIVRSAGLNGEVTATWRISPSDTAVFTTTSTIVAFADGQSEAIVTVQVKHTDVLGGSLLVIRPRKSLLQ